MARPPPRLGCSERGLLGPPRFPHACPRASSKRLPLRKHMCAWEPYVVRQADYDD